MSSCAVAMAALASASLAHAVGDRTAIAAHAMTNVAHAAAGDDSAPYAAIVAKHADAFVRLDFVITIAAGGAEQRQEGEVSAVLVSDDGLVLVADGVVNLRAAWLGAAMPGSELPDPKLSEMRVRMPGRDESIAAELVTRDADLGLAWLKLVGEHDGLPHVDLSNAAEVKVGDVYYALARVSEDFGASVIAMHGYVVGETDAPTKAFLANGPVDLAFDAQGRALGFVTRLRTRDWRYMTQYGGVVPQQMIAARRVARATQQAAEIAKRPKPTF